MEAGTEKYSTDLFPLQHCLEQFPFIYFKLYVLFVMILPIISINICIYVDMHVKVSQLYNCNRYKTECL